MPIEPLLRLSNVEKSFGEIRALKACSFELRPGEVLGLIGENGAGKSTLIKLLSGVHTPDAGTLFWESRPVHFDSPRTALSAGIATIHQELAYCGTLSVAENILLGEPWPRLSWGGVNWRRLLHEATDRLQRFDIQIDPTRPFHELSPAEKQEISIARALSRRARLLVLDEPTASLSEREVRRLFLRLRLLSDQGVAVLYVSHRLDEITELTNRVLILRDGELVGVHQTKSITVSQMVAAMVGRPLAQVYPRTRTGSVQPPLLELNNVSRPDMFDNISFQLHPGEIVGLAGLVGAGRSELARAIYGLYPIASGSMRLRGQTWKPRGPRAALRAGLVYVPEERKRHGLVGEHSVRASISIGFSDLLQRWGCIPRAERQRVQQTVRRYDIRTRDVEQPIDTLSGGNQQKTLLARWLERNPEIILLDEPTRGVDVGAKAEIHALMDKLAAAGKALLLISSDLPEVIGMSDRLLVMRQGRIAAELAGSDMTQENVLMAASGL